MNDQESVYLARVLRNGDPRAYGELVKIHQSEVRNFLRRLTGGNHSLADDLSQECFLKAFHVMHQFSNQQGGSFKNWLLKIGYRHFLTHLRKQKSRSESPLEEAVDASDEHTSKSSDQFALSQDVNAAIHQLKPEEIAVIDLHYKKGMSHSEISQVLDFPVGTVKTHLARAREKLKSLLKDYDKYEKKS